MFGEQILTKEAVFALYDIDEMSKLKNETELAQFVNSLNRSQKQQLAKSLSDWRKNQVHNVISAHSGNWRQGLIPIERITVGKINDQVNHLLERHQNRLHLLAKDPEIIGHREFAGKEQVTRLTFIAKRENNDYRLIDGNHRAITLAASGKTELSLIFPA